MLKLVVVIFALSSACAGPSILERGGNKIVGGVPANDGDYPFMANIGGCGASIIHQNWALTAAHCCHSYNPQVYVGSVYLSKNGQYYDSDQVIVHPDYQEESHWKNDICLLHVPNSIQFNDRVQAVTLPPQDLEISTDEFITITGWGDGDAEDHDRLQVLDKYHAWTNEYCTNNTRVDMNPGQLCVIAAIGQSVCFGDSGGPLSKNGVQLGLFSWFYLPCGGHGRPDVFTRVSHYVDWIADTIGEDAKDLKFAKPEDLA